MSPAVACCFRSWSRSPERSTAWASWRLLRLWRGRRHRKPPFSRAPRSAGIWRCAPRFASQSRLANGLVLQTGQRPVHPVLDRFGEDLLSHGNGPFPLGGRQAGRRRRSQGVDAPFVEPHTPSPHAVGTDPERRAEASAGPPLPGPPLHGKKDSPRSIRLIAPFRTRQYLQPGNLLRSRRYLGPCYHDRSSADNESGYRLSCVA